MLSPITAASRLHRGLEHVPCISRCKTVPGGWSRWQPGNQRGIGSTAIAGIVSGIALCRSRLRALRALLHGVERRLPRGSTVYLTGGGPLAEPNDLRNTTSINRLVAVGFVPVY